MQVNKGLSTCFQECLWWILLPSRSFGFLALNVASRAAGRLHAAVS